MASIFDLVKLYSIEWTEVSHRKFSDDECNMVAGVSVVASQYGKSACFLFSNGKRYIPLEPTAEVSIGDTLEVSEIELVALKYTGTNPDQKVTNVLRIRVPKRAQDVTFDNPFGL